MSLRGRSSWPVSQRWLSFTCRELSWSESSTFDLHQQHWFMINLTALLFNHAHFSPNLTRRSGNVHRRSPDVYVRVCSRRQLCGLGMQSNVLLILTHLLWFGSLWSRHYLIVYMHVFWCGRKPLKHLEEMHGKIRRTCKLHAKKKHLSWVQNQDLHALRQHIAGVKRKLPERDKGHQFFKAGTCKMCFPKLAVSRVPQDKNILIVEL